MPARRLRPNSRLPRRSYAPLSFLFLLLAVTLIAMKIVGRPQTWDWMFQNATAESAAPEHPEEAASVRVAPSTQPPDASGNAPETAPLPPELWDAVKDRQVGLFREEQPIVQALLKAAKNIADDGTQPGREDVHMADLQQRPAEHRGQLIALEGTLRLLETCNDHLAGDSAGPLQQGWLFTADSETMPYRVVTLEAPNSLPRGRRIEVLAKTTGYFFKLSAYQTAAGINVAPVLIGRNWRIESAAATPAASPSRSRTLGRTILTVLLGSTLALFGLMRFLWREPRRSALP